MILINKITPEMTCYKHMGDFTRNVNRSQSKK